MQREVWNCRRSGGDFGAIWELKKGLDEHIRRQKNLEKILDEVIEDECWWKIWDRCDWCALCWWREDRAKVCACVSLRKCFHLVGGKGTSFTLKGAKMYGASAQLGSRLAYLFKANRCELVERLKSKKRILPPRWYIEIVHLRSKRWKESKNPAKFKKGFVY